jgi:hypothetical protein
MDTRIAALAVLLALAAPAGAQSVGAETNPGDTAAQADRPAPKKQEPDRYGKQGSPEQTKDRAEKNRKSRNKKKRLRDGHQGPRNGQGEQNKTEGATGTNF